MQAVTILSWEFMKCIRKAASNAARFFTEPCEKEDLAVEVVLKLPVGSLEQVAP